MSMPARTCHIALISSLRFSPPFGSFSLAAEALLFRIWERFNLHVQLPKWVVHDWVFSHRSFAVMSSVLKHNVIGDFLSCICFCSSSLGFVHDALAFILFLILLLFMDHFFHDGVH